MNNKDASVITLDGPSGSGKGTIGLMLAKKLGWHFLDSGLLYRLLALEAVRQGIDISDEQKLSSLAYSLHAVFNKDVELNGEKVSDEIRSERYGEIASRIAVFPLVRAALLEKQRAFCKPPGLVADGRDMGTVVFPEAKYKFFLESSVSERAKRRYLQLKEMGQDVTLEDLLGRIAARDMRDKGRVSAPLKPAKDAVVIDTTAMGIEEVFDQIMKVIKLPFYEC